MVVYTFTSQWSYWQCKVKSSVDLCVLLAGFHRALEATPTKTLDQYLFTLHGQ